jgi:hypothetical protein
MWHVKNYEPMEDQLSLMQVRMTYFILFFNKYQNIIFLYIFLSIQFN